MENEGWCPELRVQEVNVENKGWDQVLAIFECLFERP